MVNLYNRMFEKFLTEKLHIPNGNLVEIRYEDLTKNPLQEIERIHQMLELPGFEVYRDNIKKYIELFAATYYVPYLKTYEDFKDILEEVKKKEGTIFIHDINK